MRILLIHSDYLEYETKNKTGIAEEIPEDKMKGHFTESLVVFTAVEAEDEENPDSVIENAVNEIVRVFGDVKADNVVIYPYAHLSSSLSSPKTARRVLEGMEEALRERGLEVSRVPFGWYKAFRISCKGHPLSELSRTIRPEPLKEEEESEESEWFILHRGQKIRPEEFDFTSRDLENLVKYELGELESSGEEPPHVRLMREKGLADYEPSADVGHLRWYPRGRLIRDLLADYVYMLVTSEGAMPVETPIMYDLEDEAIRVHAEKFGERQYRMKNKKELMLRYACCFGAFRILSDSFLTWKNLPASIYELSTYSFRLEKKGEVVGLKRLRGFTMPDLHTVCADLEQALTEFAGQVEMCMKTGEDLQVNYEVIFRATREFYEEYSDWVHSVADRIGKPILLELLPSRKHYWIAKMDFAAIDYLGRPIENPTVQIDVESGERFGITYVNSDEEEVNPIILHCSPTGSIERVICSLLEKTAIEMDEKPPMLPVWLSPTQVRVLPIAERHLEFAESLVSEMTANDVRADLDDRAETLGKKIRNAAQDWVPYVVVVGDSELEGKLTVNIRSTGEKVQMDLQELIELVRSETRGMPFRRLPLPVRLSERINF
ncbi:threonine--tRNA ligase [Methanothermobacter sp. KEPCO-1]|uniref:Threonine--tRNA ligase n=1 Tax=Methanothermobacter marburgensis (strain ATCC BAA-927 / DSM 2133 / JCM 14651 / NBRC 100331 / OCM 82 / Marburg) TaxID=79929 RepID=D9PYV6_METTM|nr:MULTISPECIES: threonine--tRNA ligase [Methanothermobacter]ADL57651.1 threonyl-tRNA synthetase [Methanothermobacter marburgensis str. Marburg]QEF94447.1 threonine--tRNA ligase [Methanothermobacter sp. KEPCO-1]WBF09884.1 threonine--tRNA ligase [Methanothermobacter marburgensis]